MYVEFSVVPLFASTCKLNFLLKEVSLCIRNKNKIIINIELISDYKQYLFKLIYLKQKIQYLSVYGIVSTPTFNRCTSFAVGKRKI